jgi:hypothetical protein
MSPGLVITIDTAAPIITAPVFEYEARQAVAFDLSESLGGTLTVGDVSLQNLTTAQTVPHSAIALAISDNHYRFTFSVFANGALEDGNYLMSIPGPSATDVAGNPLAAGSNLDFFVLGGDANRDRKVDVADLGVLASNWQRSPRTFSQGDFSYDAAVNVIDLGILATNWQVNLAPPPPLRFPTGLRGRSQPAVDKARLTSAWLAPRKPLIGTLLELQNSEGVPLQIPPRAGIM